MAIYDDLLSGRPLSDIRTSVESRETAGPSLMRWSPDAQRAVRGSLDKVLVRREQCESVTDTKLCEQRIDSADLHPAATAAVSQFRGIDVVLPVGRKQRQRCESIDDVLACTRTSKPLQQFLQDQSRGHNGFVALQSVAKHAHLRGVRNSIAPESE